MRLESKSLLFTFVCFGLVAGSILIYRFSLVNNENLLYKKELLTANQQELRQLKKNIDEFNELASLLEKDEDLNKEYIKEKINYLSQFDRNGVENIQPLLHAMYNGGNFFELSKLSLKHQKSSGRSKKDELPKVTFVVEGEKHVVKSQ